jgi:hypothetical protein
LKSRLEKLEDLVEKLSIRSKSHHPASPAGSINGEGTAGSAELGRLITGGGESRYIENSFWLTLSNEVSSFLILIRHLLIFMTGKGVWHQTTSE